MGAMSAGEAIVRILEAEGVKAVFGIPGGHTLPIYDALYDRPAIRHILVRHEQVAANMAAGYAQLTGEPGVCCATAGPGATNLVSGIAEAYIGALPIIILAGRGATVNAHRGASQEIAQEQLFRPITKWSVRIDRRRPHRSGAAPGLHGRALRQARAGADRHPARHPRPAGGVRRLSPGRQACAAPRGSPSPCAAPRKRWPAPSAR